MKLPTVMLDVKRQNPFWKQGDDMKTFYITERCECEVLMLNINSGTMRVRTPFKSPYANIDCLIETFFDKYEIKQKEECTTTGVAGSLENC